MKQRKNMMTRLLVALVLLIGVCVNANAGGMTLRKGGSIVGKIESNGDVRIGGSIKGRFESNGDIRVNGSIEGKIEKNGDIRKRGSIIGKIESNGDVRISGSIVGKVEKNGDIRKSGSIVGKVENMSDQRQAAVMYFFDFFAFWSYKDNKGKYFFKTSDKTADIRAVLSVVGVTAYSLSLLLRKQFKQIKGGQ